MIGADPQFVMQFLVCFYGSTGRVESFERESRCGHENVAGMQLNVGKCGDFITSATGTPNQFHELSFHLA